MKVENEKKSKLSRIAQNGKKIGRIFLEKLKTPPQKNNNNK